MKHLAALLVAAGLICPAFAEDAKKAEKTPAKPVSVKAETKPAEKTAASAAEAKPVVKSAKKGRKGKKTAPEKKALILEEPVSKVPKTAPAPKTEPPPKPTIKDAPKPEIDRAAKNAPKAVKTDVAGAADRAAMKKGKAKKAKKPSATK